MIRINIEIDIENIIKEYLQDIKIDNKKTTVVVTPKEEGGKELINKIEKEIPDVPIKRAVKIKRQKITEPRICPKCGEKFMPQGPRQKYCSEKCGMKPKNYILKKDMKEEKTNIDHGDDMATVLENAAKNTGKKKR